MVQLGGVLHNVHEKIVEIGCLLPAESFIHDEENDNYQTVNSGKKKKELFEFFRKFGKNGIKINVGI